MGTIVSSITSQTATGQGSQYHVVYATNSAKWWAFWLSADTTLACAYSSDGVTWTTPASNATITLLYGTNTLDGRNLSVYYKSISSTDVIHIAVAHPAASTNPAVGHLRATVSGTSITWSNEASGNLAPGATAAPALNYDGVATLIDGANNVWDITGFVNEGGLTSGDADHVKWPNADAGTSWTQGTGTATNDMLVTNIVTSKQAVDTGATSHAWIAVYDDTGSSNGSLTGLFWLYYNGSTVTNNGSNLLAASVTNEAANCWAAAAGKTGASWEVDVLLCSAPASGTWVARKTANGTSWASFASAPGTQAMAAGNGVGLYGDGAGNLWLFCIDSAAGNDVRWTKWNGTSWSAWTGLGLASATRKNLSVSQNADSSGNLIVSWTEGTASPYAVKNAVFSTSSGLTWTVADPNPLALGVDSATWTATPTLADTLALGADSQSLAWSYTPATDTLTLGTDAWTLVAWTYTPSADAATLGADSTSGAAPWTPSADSLTLGADSASAATPWAPSADALTLGADSFSETGVWTPSDTALALGVDSASEKAPWTPGADALTLGADSWSAVLGALSWAGTDALTLGADSTAWTVTVSPAADATALGVDAWATTETWSPTADALVLGVDSSAWTASSSPSESLALGADTANETATWTPSADVLAFGVDAWSAVLGALSWTGADSLALGSDMAAWTFAASPSDTALTLGADSASIAAPWAPAVDALTLGADVWTLTAWSYMPAADTLALAADATAWTQTWSGADVSLALGADSASASSSWSPAADALTLAADSLALALAWALIEAALALGADKASVAAPWAPAGDTLALGADVWAATALTGQRPSVVRIVLTLAVDGKITLLLPAKAATLLAAPSGQLTLSH